MSSNGDKTFYQMARTAAFKIQNYEAATGGLVPWSESPEAKKIEKIILERAEGKKNSKY